MARHLAMGMIETRGLVGAIEAADAAAKTAEVYLLRKERIDGGLVSVRFIGETAAVQEATRAGAAAAARVGHLHATHVIARLDLATARMLGVPVDDEDPAPADELRARLEAMTTAELRELARQRPEFPAQGRELNRMAKQQLVELLAELMTHRRGHE
ncbi:MAG: BMC domain-containing protein [Bacillota bacterium]